MYQNLSIFRTATAMAQHAGAAQALVARNIANADTPGYAARHLTPFSEVLNRNVSVKATRAGHLGAADGTGRFRAVDEGSEPSPSGNAVSLEDEVLRSIEAARQHDRALSIYRHAMQVVRTSIGRG